MGLEQQVWSLSDGKRLREVKAPSEKQIEDLLAANIEILDAGDRPAGEDGRRRLH